MEEIESKEEVVQVQETVEQQPVLSNEEVKVVNPPVVEKTPRELEVEKIEKRRKAKQGCFIAGVILFALFAITLAFVLGFQDYVKEIVASANGADDADSAIGAALMIIFILPILLVSLSMFLIPALGFFISSLVCLAKSIKSNVKAYRITSIILLVLDIVMFLALVVLLAIWAMA